MRETGVAVACAIALLLVACSAGSNGIPHVATTPPCSDQLRAGQVLTDAQWQGGCRETESDGTTQDIRPSRNLCNDGRNFYGYLIRAWGIGGEPVHLVAGEVASDPAAQ